MVSPQQLPHLNLVSIYRALYVSLESVSFSLYMLVLVAYENYSLRLKKYLLPKIKCLSSYDL